MPFRSASSATGGVGGATVAKPAGVVDGDVLVMSVASSGALTVLAGWTSVDTGTSGMAHSYVAWKAASGEPSTYNIQNNPNAGKTSVTIQAFSGINNVAAIDAHSTKSNASSTSVTGTHIAVANAGAPVLWIVVGDGDSVHSLTLTAPSHQTIRATEYNAATEDPTQAYLACSDEAFGAAGNTANADDLGSQDVARATQVYVIALAPALSTFLLSLIPATI